MSTTAVIALIVFVVVVLGCLVFFSFARRDDVRGAGALSGETRSRDRQARKERTDTTTAAATTTVRTGADAEAEGAAARGGTTTLVKAEETQPIIPWVAPDDEALGVSRRQFFNRATVTLMSVGIGAFSAAAFVAFLWPTGSGGFGGQVTVGKLGTIREGIKQGNGFFYAPEAKSWITEYPSEALPAAETVYPENVLVGMREGITVLSQKCPHLGCRVPECTTSQWFECQCHGSQYNRAGEKKAGPAPRGMDHHPATISSTDDVTIDTGTLVTGAAIGTNTTGQEAEGPHCTGGGEH